MSHTIEYFGLASLCALLISAGASAQQEPPDVAKALTAMDTWIVAQPKSVGPFPGVAFDLANCKGILADGEAAGALRQWASDRIAATSGVHLPVLASPDGPAVVLSLTTSAEEPLVQLGEQGYALSIQATGIALVARTPAGLRNGVVTLAQVAADRTVLPGMVIRDWPSLKYRGVQQDVSRGQVPTPDTMKRLADVLSEAKMNEMEFYLEHVFKYKAFPDVSPPEGYTPDEGRAISTHAAQAGVEVHPLLQGLGHSSHILSKPAYQNLRIGPSDKQSGNLTFDIRKPEAVQMVTTMIDELCDAFPGELFNIDITEIDVEGLQSGGMPLDQVTDLVYGYVLKLNEAVKKHHRRLMITQGPLDSQGHLAGMGPKLETFPKDIVIGSYYCAGGPYQPAWEKDFPRLHGKGIDFFAQAWICSHMWLTPWVNHSAEFSDLEVARGLQHGALGSITTDWGDAGHFHFVGEEWLPFLYHGASAWTGAKVDRDYFRKAYARAIYGLTTDAAVRAIEAASDINAKPMRVRDKDGKESEVTSTWIWEFVHDPFTHADITRIVDPAGVGQAIVAAATPAVATLLEETPKAKRNRDGLEQHLFGARCYVALGHKLVALGHFRDAAVPRKQVADELEAVAKEYELLQTEFKRLWLAEDRDNDGYQELVKRFTFTIAPCREKAKALQTS